MIELSKIALVNWHLFDVEDIDVHGDVGIIGANRSGKSTILDLIQTVFTGASKEYLRLNASANESGQKRGGRTVHAYCLGRLGEGDATVRKESLTYLALSFRDSTGKRKPVSIGLAIEAKRSESQERILARFVLEGAEVTSRDFIETDKAGRSVQLPWETVRQRLKEKADAAGGSFHNYRDAARDYVRAYMKLLLTGKSHGDERRFLKSFVNALSFEHMSTASDFVRRFILEDNPIRIRELRESIATYREVRKIIGDLTEKLEALKEIRVNIVNFADVLGRRDLQRWIGRRAQFLHAEAAYRRTVAERAAAEAARHAAASEVERINEELENQKEKLRAVEASISASGVQGKQHVLQAQKKILIDRRDAILKQIQGSHEKICRLIDLLKMREELSGHQGFVQLLEDLKSATGELTPPDWPRDAGAMDALVANLDALSEKARTHLETIRHRFIGELGQLHKRRDELQRQLGEVSQGRAVLDRRTEEMCERLRAEGMRPRILCEFLDMKDESWRDAAEALLGRDREAIIVDAEDVDKAFLIRRRERQAFHGVRLVNTRKLGLEGRKPDAGTLASVISASDPLAMAFVMRRIGNVRLAETQADLHKPGRAVMRDGTYDDGLVVETREARDRKIGVKATEIMKDSIAKTLDDTKRRIADLERDEKLYREAIRRLDEARAHFETAPSLKDLVSRFDVYTDELAENEEQLKNLNHMVDPALRRKKQEIEKTIAELEAERRELDKEDGKQAGLIEGLERTLAGGDAVEGSEMYRRRHRDQYRRVRGIVSYREGRAAYEEMLAKHKSHAGVAAAAAKSQQETEKRQADLDRLVREQLNRYFERFSLRSEFTHESRLTSDVLPWLEGEIGFIEENELTRYEAQAAEAADLASLMFRNRFVSDLRVRFESVDRAISELNNSLRDHPLHNERYTFQKSFHESYRSIEKIVELSRSGDEALLPLFRNSVPEDHPHREAIEALESLLLDESFPFEQFEDYRNFYVFDLVMEDITTGRKTRWDVRRSSGSGAEQQVPFYVAIGAALSAVYHGRTRGVDAGDLGIGIAAFDEAFSKMDGKNQRQMLAFYRSIGLQNIIAGPFESRTLFLESMDCLVEVFRHGDQAQIDVRKIKERAREEMRAINPDYIPADTLEQMATESKPVELIAAE